MQDYTINHIITTLKDGNYKNISLDFFDTIVIRKTEIPTDIFLLVGAELIDKKYLINISSPEEFKKIRIKAEEKARQVKNKNYSSVEVDIYEIYNFIYENNLIIKDFVKECIDIELAIELDNIYLNPRIIPLLRFLNLHQLKYFIISDTYFSENFIKKIIKKINSDNESKSYVKPVSIFISNSYGTGKGLDLFPRIINELQLDVRDLFHIGDNGIGDYKKPLSYGISAFHLQKFTNYHEKIQSYEKTCRYKAFIANSHVNNIRSYSAFKNKYKKETDEFKCFDYGSFVQGPIFVHFVLSVLIKAANKNCTKIVFIAREGVYLKKLFDSIKDYYQIDVSSEILYFSRYISFINSINDINKNLLQDLYAKQRLVPSVINFLEMLYIDFLDYSELESLVTKSMHDLEVREQVYAVIVDNKDSILVKIQEQQLLTREYLKGIDLSKALLVDIGWGGTIQKELSLIDERFVKIPGYYLLLDERRCFDVMLETGVYFDSFLPTEDLSFDFYYPIIRSPNILEKVCMPDHGTTIAFQKRGDHVGPVFEKTIVNEDIQNIKIIQEGIESYQSGLLLYYKQFDTIVRDETCLKDYSQEILARSILFPLEDEAILFSKISHEDNFGSKESLPIITKEYDISNKSLKQLDTDWKNCLWPQGQIAVNNKKTILPLFNYMQLHNVLDNIGTTLIKPNTLKVNYSEKCLNFSRYRNKIKKIIPFKSYLRKLKSFFNHRGI